MSVQQSSGRSVEPDPIDFLFLAPLEEERAAILSRVPNHRRLPPDERDIRVYYRGELPVEFPDGTQGTYRIVVTSPIGMGRVDAAAVTLDAIRRWQPRFVLVVGIAGGDGGKVSLGDVLVADQFVDCALRKETDEGPQIRYQTYRADARLLNAARHLTGWESGIKEPRPEPGSPRRYIGPVLSGDAVQSRSDGLAVYKRDYPSLLGVEMEAGGVALAAWQAEIKPGVLMIRAVSDLADAHKGSHRTDQWRPYACDVAAAYAVSLVSGGFVPLRGPAAIERPEATNNSVRQANALPAMPGLPGGKMNAAG